MLSCKWEFELAQPDKLARSAVEYGLSVTVMLVLPFILNLCSERHTIPSSSLPHRPPGMRPRLSPRLPLSIAVIPGACETIAFTAVFGEIVLTELIRLFIKI